MFTGSMVAIVTPFKNNKIDERGLADLVDWQIQNGTNVIVPCGTTGESATLSHDEHHRVMEIAVWTANKRVPIIAGTGSNCTEEALSLTKKAKEYGCDAALIITPYYIKPTQEGLYRHYKRIAETIDIPIILYNVPGRTGVSLEVDTVVKLNELPNIIGIKDATGNLDYASEISSKCDITIYSGNDSLNLPLLGIGAKGAISVLANIIPNEVSKMISSFLNGDHATSLEIHKKYFHLTKLLFAESNPIPIKAALELMGKISPEIRMPLTPLLEKYRLLLKKEMEELGII